MSKLLTEELWKNILEFPDYNISSLGRVYNVKRNMIMSTSLNNYGHVKITLAARDRTRHTRSVAQLVAEAFVEAPTLLCDQIIVLDGDFTNVSAENLAWRPRWFAWKYTHQLKTTQPPHYRNLQVMNIVNDNEYRSIIVAGMYEGLLFSDIWRSTYTGEPVYPTNSVFEVLDRV